jgi:RNA polymerase sigma-70 factor (ECF subfamily)
VGKKVINFSRFLRLIGQSMENTLEIEIAEVRPKVLALTRKFFRASRLEGDPEDVLIRLWEARRSGADIRNPQAWAVTITKNACVSLWRKSRHNRQEPLPLSLASADSATLHIEQAEARQRADQALNSVPAATLRLLQLRASGLSLDEIAAITGRPKGSIKASISIARKELIKSLQQ